MIETIRDIVIIVWGIIGILAFLVIIVVALALFRAVSPILKSVRATTATVQTTTTMMSEVVIRPLVRVASFYTGLRQGARTLGRFRRKKPA